MNWRGGEPNSKILQHSTAFFHRFDHGAALKIKRKMSHFNIAFDRYASIGTVIHYILVISLPVVLQVTEILHCTEGACGVEGEIYYNAQKIIKIICCRVFVFIK